MKRHISLLTLMDPLPEELCRETPCLKLERFNIVFICSCLASELLLLPHRTPCS